MDFECSVCGIPGNEARLMEAISSKGKGIVKVCESCSVKGNMPILKRPTTFQLKEAERNPVAKRVASGSNSGMISPEREKTESSLREIVDRNYEKLSREKKPRPDLIDHFHWVIMRARRKKKLTHEQLAREISESTAAVRMAEDGILPDNDYLLVNKLESFLGIRLVKDRNLKPSGEREETKQPSRIIKFDQQVMKNLTIDDLRRMKREKEDLAVAEKVRESMEDVPVEQDDSKSLPSVFSSEDEGKSEKEEWFGKRDKSQSF